MYQYAPPSAHQPPHGYGLPPPTQQQPQIPAPISISASKEPHSGTNSVSRVHAPPAPPAAQSSDSVLVAVSSSDPGPSGRPLAAAVSPAPAVVASRLPLAADGRATSQPTGAAAAAAAAAAGTASVPAAEVSGDSDRDGLSRPTSPDEGSLTAPPAPAPPVPTQIQTQASDPARVAPSSTEQQAPSPAAPPAAVAAPAPASTAAAAAAAAIAANKSAAGAADTDTAAPAPTAAKSNPTKKKKKKSLQGTEAKMLSADSKDILGRITSRESTMVSRRAFAYEPTLEIFQEYSFSDYVRGALLGVSGVVDWESSDEEEEDDEDDEDEEMEGQEMKDGEEKVVKMEEAKDARSNEGKEDNAAAASEQANASTATNAPAAAAAVLSTPPPKKKREEKDMTPTRKSARQAARKARARKKSDPLPPETPARTSARIKAKKEDDTSQGPERCANGQGKSCSCCGDLSEASPSSGRKQNISFDPFENMSIPNEMLLADGIAKITPPKGWWDHAGIGGDLTARGPIWSKGGRLGDMDVTTPIRQCASGIGGVYEYTMLELPPVPVHEFREKADQYRKRQIREEHSDDTSDEYMDTLARKFWKRLGPTMEASVYGADQEGTLFDGADACGWNVDRLESALALLGADMDEEGAAPGEPAGRLPGVTTAYLYYGMWGSTFAAHTEDMNLLSINYLHAGAPKFWYAIDPKDAARFESLATSLFPAASRDCPDFLRHKRYLISPSILNKAGITYTTQVQRAGDAIITFPGSYHFGFNTGFNVAESTNFAVPEWLPYGQKANICLCHPHSVRIDMDRFKDLLAQYEIRNIRLRQLQRKRLTYSEFARAEAARRRKVEESRRGPSDDDEEEEEEEGPSGYGSIRPVEVVHMKTTSNTAAAIARRSKAKKGGAMKKKKIAPPREQWRRAKRAWPSSFREKAPVLCFMSAAAENYDEEGQPSEKCFAGTVIDVCEGHCRIRWDGCQRKDDMWVKTDSTKLFIDDGSVNRDSDSEDDDGAPAKKKKPVAKKKPASKKRRVI